MCPKWPGHSNEVKWQVEQLCERGDEVSCGSLSKERKRPPNAHVSLS